MSKACLFDLDGTLLPMDTEAFVKIYLGSLAPQVAHLIPPDKLVKMIWQATEEMIKNTDRSLTNAEVFEQSFLKRCGLNREDIWPIFDQFYRDEFPKLQDHVGYHPLMREVVLAAVDRGYKVAVATNPVFPKEAIHERMRWAGVADLPFEVITIYEEMHFCKPQPQYYLEVAERLGVKPSECIMIGNDMQEDMIASTTGMKTYYLDQHRIDRGQPRYPFDMEGTVEELLAAIREGKGIFRNDD